MNKFKCPVCKWKGLSEKVKWPYGTHEICECCGSQFGFDVQEDSDILKVRREWLSEGAEWFSDDSEAMPRNWSLDCAKKQISNNE